MEWDHILPPTNIKIQVDANTDPLNHVGTVIHELMHVVLCRMALGLLSKDYEEVGILAYEKDMYDYVKRSPERLAKWNRVIASKLEDAEGSDDAPTSRSE